MTYRSKKLITLSNNVNDLKNDGIVIKTGEN